MALIRNTLNKLLAKLTSDNLQELWDVEVHLLDKKTKKLIGGEGI